MNPNIMKTQNFYKMRYDLKGHFMSFERFRDFLKYIFRLYDMITFLTYVLIDNFCFCGI